MCIINGFHYLTTCISACGKKPLSKGNAKLLRASGNLTMHGQIFMTIRKQPSWLAEAAGSLKSDPNWCPAQAPYYLCIMQQQSRALCIKPQPNIC